VTRFVVRPEAHVYPFVPLFMNVYSTNRTASAVATARLLSFPPSHVKRFLSSPYLP
jgi:hypothetical protein